MNRSLKKIWNVISSMQSDATSSPTSLDLEMPVVMLDGYEYVGYVEIPALELKLPVMSDWDYNRLTLAPCRQFGSSRTDDLVIAAHNYESHFGHLKDLSVGDAVTFTDMFALTSSAARRSEGSPYRCWISTILNSTTGSMLGRPLSSQ